MKVFAIDPGNVNSAYCIMDDQYNLLEFKKSDNRDVMQILLSKLDEVDEVCIERMMNYSMNVGKTVYETCEWIGRFSQEAEKKALVNYIYRKDEKMNLCETMSANDAMIRRALIDRFAKTDTKRGTGTKKKPDFFYGVSHDVWSSIAIAVTYLDMKKN